MTAREHIDWFMGHLLGGAVPEIEDIQQRFQRPMGPSGASALQDEIGNFLKSNGPFTAASIDEPSATSVSSTFVDRNGKRFVVRITSDSATNQIASLSLTLTPHLDGLDVRPQRGVDVGSSQREAMHALMHRCYQDASDEYLDHQLAKLAYAALAVHENQLVGFALGETRTVDLPRLPAQPVVLLGLTCVAPEHRRHGLMSLLSNTAVRQGVVSMPARLLQAGRMAHPASMRAMRSSPSVVPKPGITPTVWQQEVGAVVAREYGVRDFDSETFVCRGTGTPIGTPAMDLDVEDHEWEVFKPVDRSRGDALLAVCWTLDVPQGWTTASAPSDLPS